MTWTSDRKTGYFWKHYGHRSGPSISAQEVSHAVITAAMRVHLELGRGCWRVLTRRVCSTNRIEPVFKRRVGLPWFIEVQGLKLGIELSS